jgi:hypothetical protein
MHRIVYGCLLGLGGWVAAALAIGWLLQGSGVSSDAVAGASVLGGLLAWAGIALLYSGVRGLREWLALRAAVAGREPSDGAGAVLAGTLQARAACLQAPFDGSECVAYDYRVVSDRGAGRKRTIVTCFEGVGLAPCTLATATGYYRLLTVPELDPASTASPAPARDAVERYVRATTFLPRTESASELLRRWDDADGVYRSDIASVAPGEVDWSSCTFSQHVLKPDSRVCVIGYFSTTQRAFVVPPAWAAPTRILAGRPEEIAAAIAATARGRLIMGLIALAAAALLVWAIAANNS